MNYEIKITRANKNVTISNKHFANQYENLQGKLVFSFTDEFVYGTGRLAYRVNDIETYEMLKRVGETYEIPIKDILTNENEFVLMQLVINEPGNEYVLTKDEKYKEHKEYFNEQHELLIEGTDYNIGDNIVGNIYELDIPKFRSNIFEMYVGASINDVDIIPTGYDSWLDYANAKLALMDTKIDEVDNLNITAEKEDNVTTITITDKQGVEHTTEVLDGEKGDTGEQGPIGPQGLPGTNGQDGRDGVDGQDGFSPIANVNKVGKVATITITDKLGTTTAQISDGEEQDLTDYVKNTDYANSTKGGVIKVNSIYGGYIDSNGNFMTTNDSYSTYQNRNNNAIIGKGTLENALTGKGLVKATTISSSSTDDNVVTPKAVYNYIQSLDGTEVSY